MTLVSKLKEWPPEILKKPLDLRAESLELIILFNDIRGNLTHPKTHGHDIYAKLETVDSVSVIVSVAEYIVRFHETEGTIFPYWLFGWNYLNPRTDSYEIRIMNETQFCFSLQALGFQVSAATQVDQWVDQYLRTFEGYMAVSQALGSLDRCEPKPRPFPFKPILCRRWWTSEHQQSCGRITDETLNFARNLGNLGNQSL